MIQFIASDIDGTLLQGNKRELDPRIFEVILELKELGVRFAAASGRQYHGLRELFHPVQDEISYVTENGSFCVHNDQVLARGLIERELGLRIFQTATSHGYIDCILSCESKMYTNSKNSAFVQHLRDYLNYNVEQVDDLSSINEDFLKIAFYNDKNPKEMKQFFSQEFVGEIKVASSGDYWVDFIAPNANKATGLASVLEYFQIPPENCITFGDQYNDVEMLQYSGTSYAMSTAAPGISYYSTYVTDSVLEVLEDVLANAKIANIE